MTRSLDRNVHVLQEHLDVPVIYMSTCGLYDRSLEATKHEDDTSQIKIESPYFSAKADGERLFEGNRRATLLRLSAPIGPGLKPTVVLSRFIMAARTQTPIPIWGSGSREQNFIDVRDVADLILKVLADPQPCTLNVAGRSPTTMTNLAKTVIATVGTGSYEFSGIADPHEGETARYSISKARDLYDWWPKHDLTASCELVVNEDFESYR
jgi:nucleoside-diphosphate-sugar epimerase